MAQDVADHAEDAMVLPEISDIANLFHRFRQQDVAGDGGGDHQQDRRPCVCVSHELPRMETSSGSLSCSGFGEECSGGGVSAGPPATKPTPEVMSRMPIQRAVVTCSCRTNLAISAMIT